MTKFPTISARIDVLICTFRRASIVETLQSIDTQRLPEGVSAQVLVADNDDAPSAAALISIAASTMKIPVLYIHAPARNISIARNACLNRADGDFVAFLDDDERADPDWLASLYRSATSNGFDAVFGPVLADYVDSAPDWISAYDYLSTWPLKRRGEVQTGYTGNALLRWRGSPHQNERFLIEKGRTGGEDTEFFFRLWRKGARFGICEHAIARETVDPRRLTFAWVRRRKFRAGQTYGRHSASARAFSIGLAASSLLKIATCGVMATATFFSEKRKRYWVLRGIFHYGVFTAQLGLKESAFYGA